MEVRGPDSSNKHIPAVCLPVVLRTIFPYHIRVTIWMLLGPTDIVILAPDEPLKFYRCIPRSAYETFAVQQDCLSGHTQGTSSLLRK